MDRMIATTERAGAPPLPENRSSAPSGLGTAAAEWKQHWKTLTACMVGTAASITHLGSIGVLIPEIQS